MLPVQPPDRYSRTTLCYHSDPLLRLQSHSYISLISRRANYSVRYIACVTRSPYPQNIGIVCCITPWLDSWVSFAYPVLELSGNTLTAYRSASGATPITSIPFLLSLRQCPRSGSHALKIWMVVINSHRGIRVSVRAVVCGIHPKMVVPGWSAEWNSDPRYMNCRVWCTSNTIHRHLMHAITCIVSLYIITTGSDDVRLLLASLPTLSVNGVSSTLLISSASLSSTALTSIMTGVVSGAWTQRYVSGVITTSIISGGIYSRSR